MSHRGLMIKRPRASYALKFGSLLVVALNKLASLLPLAFGLACFIWRFKLHGALFNAPDLQTVGRLDETARKQILSQTSPDLKR